MIINTTAGKTYAVTPQTDCTVSTTDGILIATCAAGEQTLFVAPGAEVEVSDDAALVTESFKGAPAGLSAVWGSIKKVSASLASKLNVSTFNAHKADATVHVTSQEREKWNGKQDNLTDASGNMTLDGSLTAAGTINANGGVNIPLAVGAPTDTAAVNRLYAAGLSTVIEAFSPQSFLSNFNLYGGSVAVDQTVPGWFWKLRKTSADTGTVKVNLTNPFFGVGNYSGWCGFILPLMPGNFGSTGTFKFSFLIGGGGSGLVEKTAAQLDMFTRSPAARNTSPFLRAIDVTFYFGGDGTSTPSTPIRVRELMYDSGASKWIVHESQSVLKFGNTNLSQSVFLTYQQDSPGNSAKAGLWIGSNGAASQRLLLIANLHAVPDTYSFLGVSSIYWDCEGSNSYSHIGSMRQMILPGHDSTNGAYDAFQALETRLIQSTSTYDFTPYE